MLLVWLDDLKVRSATGSQYGYSSVRTVMATAFETEPVMGEQFCLRMGDVRAEFECINVRSAEELQVAAHDKIVFAKFLFRY